MEATDIIIAPSLTLENVYYIFRERGPEIRIDIRHNSILPSHEITPEEIKYIKKNILQVGEKIIK